MRKKQKEFSEKLRSYFLRNQFAVRYGWIALRMTWSITRVTLVFKVFSKHSDGAFLHALLVDLTASFTESWATGRAVLAYATPEKSDDKTGRKFIALAVMAFVAPEVLLILFWRGLSEKIVIGVGIFIVCSLSIFLAGMARKVKACKN